MTNKGTPDLPKATTPVEATKDLEEILDRGFYCNHCGWAMQLSDATVNQLKQALQSQINKQILEARIDELKRIVDEWYTNPQGEVRVAPGSVADQITDRITAIQSEKARLKEEKQ